MGITPKLTKKKEGSELDKKRRNLGRRSGWKREERKEERKEEEKLKG